MSIFKDNKFDKKLNKDNKNYKKERDILDEKIYKLSSYVYKSGVKKKFSLTYNKSYKNLVYITLLKNNKKCYYNYLDDEVREICKILANDLKDIFNKNIYFDLINGELNFFL